MLNLIRADLYKLRKSTAMKILFAITTFCAVAMASLAYLIPNGNVDNGMSQIGFMFSDVDIMSILGGVIAGIFICGDFDNKTIHDAVAGGCSRASVIASKTIVFFCALFMVLMPYVVVTGVALACGARFDMGSVAVGFLNILSSESGIAFSSAMWWKTGAAMLTLAVVYLAQLSICVPLAVALRKPVVIVGICYGFSLISAQLNGLGKSHAMLRRFISFTPYGGDYSFVTYHSGSKVLAAAVAVSLMFAIVMFGVAYRIFQKSEIR